MRTKSIGWFEGKISQVLSRNPNIQDIHEVAILALRNQRQSDINNFYLDCALERLMVKRHITFKKKTLKTTTLLSISLAA